MKRSLPKKTREAIPITPNLLRQFDIPRPDGSRGKDGRGDVIVVGGSEGMPGGAILAALAVLRAGAGRLRIATPRSIAESVAQSLWEAKVISLPERKPGVVSDSAWRKIGPLLSAGCDAILIGPAMEGTVAVSRLVGSIIPLLGRCKLVLDAEALKFLRRKHDLGARGRILITPHAGEMADLMGLTRNTIEKDPEQHALSYARETGIITVLKGDSTFIATPDGELYCNKVAGNCGLAISGSGDVLAGTITGLLARSHDPVRAALWGVYLHAKAGDLLARRIGPLGYLPRELLPEIPGILGKLNGLRS